MDGVCMQGMHGAIPCPALPPADMDVGKGRELGAEALLYLHTSMY